MGGSIDGVIIMKKYILSEDEVRDKAREILGFFNTESAMSGVGQITSFKKLGFSDSTCRPDGWYFPNESRFPAIVLETKREGYKLDSKCKNELLRNIEVVRSRYRKVVGILYNGEETIVYKNDVLFSSGEVLRNKEYYLGLYEKNNIDKELIYTLTKSINDTLHIDFGINNLYHRMIFTACALVAKRYGAMLVGGMSFDVFSVSIKDCLRSALSKDLSKNIKLNSLLDVYSQIRMNSEGNQQAIDRFIENITLISDNINSDFWNGEDVMAIFFNEFNRYKKKAEQGQVFTPDHITSLMYRITDTTMSDVVLDAACGSGAFLIKAMCNMISESGGIRTEKADHIVQTQLYGIEFHKEIYALACANMLIHKDGKTNLKQLDSRGDEAAEWIKSIPITRVLMNPPFENKFGCLEIVSNVLDNVSKDTICAFILPDNKLNKNPGKTKRILKYHRLEKIIKLPEKLFSGTVTSIFIFRAGVAQGNHEIFSCYIEDDGLETVKNKGRQDVRNSWAQLEDNWVEIIKKQTGHESIKWIKPNGKLNYQMDEAPISLTTSDFNETVLNYELFAAGVDEIEFRNYVTEKLLYGCTTESDRKLIKSFSHFGQSEIDMSEWEKYSIATLFYQPERPAARSKLRYKEGSVPFVASGNKHNGVECEVSPLPGEKLDKGKCITVSPVDGSTFYQPVDFLGRGGAGSSVILLRLRTDINESIGLFLSTVIRKVCSKYKFADMANSKDLPNELLILPKKSDGNPDWIFMDKMIKKLTEKARKIVMAYKDSI